MKTFTKLVPLALLVLPFGAFAASLYGGTAVNITTGTGVSATVDANVYTGGNASSSSGNTDSHTTAGVDVNVGGNGNTTVQSTADIAASAEFKAVADSAKASDERVQAVDLNNEGAVDVAYRHDGKLFGFLPIKVTSHTLVKAQNDGTVSVQVKLPWWSFLVSGVSKVRSDLEASLQANAEVKADAMAEASASSRARLAQAIVASLMAYANGSADANASAGANATTNTSTGY
jgi:hypothetical protein